jgi:lycopene cyclase domain-containing protein
VNVSCFAVPFLFSFYPAIRFYRHWKSWLVGAAGTMLLFIPWDIAFTHMGVWGFNQNYLLGNFLVNLPAEEWLFFVAIPYACVFTYHCFRTFIKNPPAPSLMKTLAIVMLVAAMITGLLHFDRWYTATAHFAAAIMLALHIFVWKSRYLPWFVLMYLVILVPFVISNGVLTGLEFWQYPFFNSEPDLVSDMVVWYNNAENLGVRIFSMPVDDLAYGLTMLLLNVTIYERFHSSRLMKAETA